MERGEETCQYIPGACVDQAIGERILNALSPLSLDVALEVQEELRRRALEIDRLRKQQVQRAEYEATLAQRRYLRVDPDNRLVANTLEAAWNEKLRALRDAHEQYEKHRQADALMLSDEERRKVQALASDFPKLWHDPNTPIREKKRMIRLLIEDVTLIKDEQIIAQVRFKAGVSKRLQIPRPPKGWQRALTDPKVVELVDTMLDDHNYVEIAQFLNERGYTSGSGRTFTRRLIGNIRRNDDLKTRYARLRKSGKLTLQEVTNLLGVDKRTVWKLREKGILKAYPYNERNECLYEHPGTKRISL